MSRALALLALSLTACAAPAIDDVLWSCEQQSDCDEGFVCSTRARACVEPTSTAPGVTAQRIGVVLSAPLVSGPTELGKSFRAGAEAYFHFINSNGGVDGRTIELIALDDGGEPARALANVQNAVEDRTSLAVFGPVGTEAVESVVPYLVDQRAIVFGPYSGSNALRHDPPDRYVFNVRASFDQEATRAVGYLTSVKSPVIPPRNVAVFAQGNDDAGNADAYGRDGFDAVAEALRVQHGVAAADIELATHLRGTQDVDAAVGRFLHWLGHPDRTLDTDNSLHAAIVLVTTARSGAALVKELLDELHKIHRGTSFGLDFELTQNEVERILNVDELLFLAISTVGSDELAYTLDGFGDYQTVSGNRRYCASVLATQVVPSVDSSATGILEFKTHLADSDPTARADRVGLEGYLVARLFVEGLLDLGPKIEVESLVDTFDALAEVDVGIGTMLGFSPSKREAMDKVWGASLTDACSHQDFDLGTPGVPMQPPDDDCVGGVCVITGTLTNDTTLTADKRWLLRGTVFVGNGTDPTVLTIEPGTVVLGEVETTGALIIKRNSKLMAIGTRDAPIVFTSARNPGERGAGDWGGVVLNGNAPVNGCETAPCEQFGEGGTGFYGGDAPADSSGELKYVRIEFAGKLISPDNELNALTLQGVGTGTLIDYVQLHRGTDDGLEFFGGTAQVKHVLVTGTEDDSVDWQFGWTGRAQFVIAQQWPGVGNHGIEADNNEFDFNSSPRSHPTLSNITLVGVPTSEFSDYGILLRRGTAGNISNTVVLGFNDACLNIDQVETFTVAASGSTLTGDLTISNSIMSCTAAFEEDVADPFMLSAFYSTMNSGNRLVDPLLRTPYSTETPDFRPAPGSPALTGAVVPTDPFFDQVTYVGALGAVDDWTVGWTTNVPN